MKTHILPSKALKRLLTPICSLSLLGLIALMPTIASATDWKHAAANPPVDQDWNNPNNWSAGVPGGGFFIRNITGGLFPIIDGNLAATANGNSFIGAFTAGNSRLDIRSGSLAVTGNLLIGPDNPSSAIVNLANTSVLDATNISGYALGSGSASVTNGVTLARRNNSNATLNINTTGGFSGENASVIVGGGGTGTVNLASGSFNTSHFAGGLVLGGVSDNSPDTGTGTFNMSGGTMGDGTASRQRFIRVGREGTGTFNQSGGAVNLGNDLEIGVNAGSNGTVNLSGGTFSAGITRVGVSGTGTLNVSDSGAFTGRSFEEALVLGVNASSAGTVNLDGGSVRLRSVQGGAGTSTFNFNGGTLVFDSFFADAFEGLTEANILAGGAFIDTEGNSVGIAQALQGVGDLTKIGANTLTLTGANTFTGGLNVLGGTLSITSAFLNGGAIVNIASDSFLNLNYIGDNAISALILNGISMDAGTYDASSTFLTGTGTLTVIPEPSTIVLMGVALAALLGFRRLRN